MLNFGWEMSNVDQAVTVSTAVKQVIAPYELSWSL